MVTRRKIKIYMDLLSLVTRMSLEAIIVDALKKLFLLFSQTVIIITVTLFVYVAPIRRGFFCDDDTIRYPYKSETIGPLLLFLPSLLLPSLIILMTEILLFKAGKSNTHTRKTSDMMWMMYNELMTFIIAYLAMDIVMLSTKVTTGRLRPHFIHVCQPKDLAILCPVSGNGHKYIEEYTCEQTNAFRVEQLYQSFFSGHASIAAFCTWFIVVSIW